MDGSIPLRAEHLDTNTLVKIKKKSPTLEQNTKDIVNKVNEETQIVEISAPKGVGKTLAFRSAQIELYEKHGILSGGIRFNPESIVDTNIPPITIITPEEHISPEEQIDNNKEPEVIVIDNVHYLFDLKQWGIIDNKPVQYIGKIVLQELEKDKQVILVDETPLDILRRTPHTKNIVTGNWNKVHEKLVTENKTIPDENIYEEYWITIKTPDLEELARIYNVEYSEDFKNMMRLYGDRTPRSFVNIVNKCGKELTVRSIVKAFEKELRTSLKHKIDKRLLDYMISNPVIHFDPKTASKIARKYGINDSETLNKKIQKCEKEYQKIKRELSLSYPVELGDKILDFIHKIKSTERIEETGISARTISNYISQLEWTAGQLNKLKNILETYSDLEFISQIVETNELFQKNQGEWIKYLNKLSRNYTETPNGFVISNRALSELINREINKGSYLLEMLIAMENSDKYLE